MTRKRAYLRILLIILVSLSLGISAGCSRDKNDVASARVKEVQQAVSELEREQASQPQEADECKMHKYFVNPGETAYINFQELIDARTAKAVQAEEPAVDKRGLDAKGYSASVSRSVDSFSKSAAVWFVSHPIFGKRDDAPTARAVSEGNLFIQGNGAGDGVILGVGDIKGAAAVGQLSREQLTRKLNGKNTIGLIDVDLKRHEVTPEQKTVDMDFNILVAEVKLDVPKDVGQDAKIANASIAWAKAKTRLEFRVSYDRAQGKYVVTGPAFSRECIK